MLALAKKVFLLFLFFLIIFLCTVYSISYAAWEQVNEGGFGDTNNEIAGVMSLFDGSLYVGTGSTLVLSAISGIWRSPDGTTWEPVNTNGFGDTNNTACDSMVVYGDYLYGGTSNESGCELWRSSDGTVWDRVNDHGFGDTNNDYFPSMIVYDDLLYAGTGNVSTGCELWRSPDGTAWDQVNADGFGDSNNTVCYAMIVYDDLLYVGTGNVSTGFQVWRSSDGTTWDQVNTDGFGDRNNTVCTAMIVYGGYLYVGTRNKVTGCELWRSPDGTTWDQVNTDGFGDGRNEYSLSMIVYDYLLYAGTANSLTGCQIWCSSNGTTWEQSNADGLGDSNNKDCPSMIIYGDYLYAGTSNRSTGCQIWRYSEFLTFTISGSVTGAVSSFVPVHLTGTDSQIVKTDASGNYHFTGLASGAYVITPELEGYKFEPPNHKIKSLAGDLSDRDFVSRRAHPCAAETIYGENAKEVDLLRNVRDTVLSQTPEGKEIVRLYYQWSPAIAEAMKKNDEFKKEVKEMLDGFLSTIEEGG